MHISPFHARYPDPLRLAEAPDLFDAAKERYNEFESQQLFLTTDRPGFFLYQIQTQQRQYLGLLACTDVADYLCGDIKKHELTLPAEVEKQMQLTLERQASVKPVLLVYPDAPPIDTWTANYVATHEHFLQINFANDLEIHRLWAVQEPTDIQQLQTLFADNVPHSYIADGHHRMSAMGLLSQSEDNQIRKHYKNIYCAFFPSIELDILAFNRIVELPKNFQLAQLESVFHMQPLTAPAAPTRIHELMLCTIQGWFKLHWKAEALQAFVNEAVVLDTMLLNEQVLAPILGIENIRHDRRVEYVEAPKGLAAIEQKIAENPNKIGFCLYPVSFTDLMTLVEADKTLPPKSTWFEPRMKNGLLVKPY